MRTAQRARRTILGVKKAMTPDRPGGATAASLVALAQGGEWAVTGAWAVAHPRSFQAVTGPKIELWLVKTVGALVGALGSNLFAAGARRSVSPELASIGASTAAAVGAVEAYYSLSGRISKVYLADAFVQVFFVAAWAYALKRGLRRAR